MEKLRDSIRIRIDTITFAAFEKSSYEFSIIFYMFKSKRLSNGFTKSISIFNVTCKVTYS